MLVVVGDGRLAKDPEVKVFGRENKTLVEFPIVSDGRFGSENSTYIKCTMFNRDENFAQYLHQGDQVFIKGYLNINKGSDGNYYTSLIVDELVFGAKKQ